MNVSKQLEICTYFSINKQYVQWVQNGKSVTWQVWLISSCGFTSSWQGQHRHLYCSKKRSKKEIENEFLTVTWHYTRPSNRHACSLRKIIIYCLLTYWTNIFIHLIKDSSIQKVFRYVKQLVGLFKSMTKF